MTSTADHAATSELLAAIDGGLGPSGLRSLVAGRATRRLVHRSLDMLATSLPARRTLRLRRVTWKPGRNARASYDLRCDGGVVPLQLRWMLDRPEPAPTDRARPRDRAALATLAPAHAAVARFAGDDGMAAMGRLLVWPADPDRPLLAELIYAGLAPMGLASGQDPLTLRVLRYRPGQRHVLVVHGPSGPLFVKIGRPGDVASTTARAEAVARALAVQPVRIADVVLVSDDWGAVAYRGVPGRPLTTLIGRDPAVACAALTATGSALAALHRSADPSRPMASVLGRLDPTTEAAVVLRSAEHLDVLAPAARGDLASLVVAACDVLTAEPAGTALLHNDAKCDHILVDGSSPIGLIDLDSVTTGDPASDVARLLADLVWHAPSGSIVALRRAVQDGYGPEGRSFGRRVAAWETLAIVKQAMRRISVLDPLLTEKVAAQLTGACRALDRAAGPRPGDW